MFISMGEIKDALRVKLEREREYVPATPDIDAAHKRVIGAYLKAIRAIEAIGPASSEVSQLLVARMKRRP